MECGDIAWGGIGRPTTEEADDRRRLLRARRERLRGCGGAEQPDELASPHGGLPQRQDHGFKYSRLSHARASQQKRRTLCPSRSRRLNVTGFPAETTLQATWLVPAIVRCGGRAQFELVDTAALLFATVQEAVDAKASAANLFGLLRHRFSPARESRKEGSSSPCRVALLRQSRAARSGCLSQERICRSPRKWSQYERSGHAPSRQKDARMPPCAALRERAKSNRSGPVVAT